MRLASVFLAALAIAAPASAQYFHEGWAPGKPIPTPNAQPSSFDHTNAPLAPVVKKSKSISSFFTLETFLTSAPVAGLLQRVAGVNITERLELAAEAAKRIWDDRVPLITDDNYYDLIVNEELTEQEEKDRVWFLIITVTAAQGTGISSYADEQFDLAFNETVVAGDLTNVRWGRIDYINVTAITTRWAVWQAPMIVLLKDRGQTLRFWRAHQIYLKPEPLREFLATEQWQHTPPWSTAYAPGGKREWLMEYLAIVLTKIYESIRWLPRWALYIITGTLGTVLIQVFHRGEKE
ncbi:hypothetical protein BV25DRAFT_1781632, partial [Artomyces pyxidatus]